jgi:hypothetical protein
MRAISLLTMTFLPFSAVSAVFGTQFFGYYSSYSSSSSSSSSSPSSETTNDNGNNNKNDEIEIQHFQINPSFWIMFLFAVPLTVMVVAWWYTWEKGYRCRLLETLGTLGTWRRKEKKWRHKADTQSGSVV